MALPRTLPSPVVSARRVPPPARVRPAPPFPRSINIQLTSRCNLRCIMCNHDRLTAPRGDMPFEMAARLLDEIADQPGDSISLQNMGESFLHPRLVELIAHAVERGIQVRMVTNGTLVDEETARGLIASGLQRIAFSVEAYTRERYEQIRRGARFETVVQNIRTLHRLRDEAGSPMQIELHWERYQEDEQFVKEYARFWRPWCDVITVAPLTRLDGIQYVGRDGRVVPVPPPPTPAPRPCRFPFGFAVIKHNGDVCPCCVVSDHQIVLGNVKDRTLSEVWNDEPYRRLREAAGRGDFRDWPACAACTLMRQ
ncbi:MAG: Coenzyme PQQ synthesis protein E [Phycisphaerae bacterium]|nr:Coenzyme PQQ synthesis protein E [Phycisphaerae bacterium]